MRYVSLDPTWKKAGMKTHIFFNLIFSVSCEAIFSSKYITPPDSGAHKEKFTTLSWWRFNTNGKKFEHGITIWSFRFELKITEEIDRKAKINKTVDCTFLWGKEMTLRSLA